MTPDRWLVVRARTPPVSLRLDRRVPPILLALLAGILGVGLVNVAVGEYPVSPLDVIKIVAGVEGGNGSDRFVVSALRLPRTVVAVAAGMGLAAAGAILQGITGNPLAAPSVLGVTQGASLAVVTTLVAFPGVSPAFLPPIAFAGAASAALLVYVLAWRNALSPGRLVLVGIGVAAVATALTTAMITLGEIHRVQSALVWMVGSVHARGWTDVGALVPWLLVFLPLAFLGAKAMNSLRLGDEVATGLGSRVEVERGLLLATSVALAGAAVATAGAIGFVGLMAPHLARRLVGPSHEGLLPTATLLGGLLVVAADLVGRTAFPPVEIPCGIVTAILGAPYFGYLLYRGDDP